jgi:hypothetical protein
MIKDVTKTVAPEALELNIEPSVEVINLLLNYSKSIDVVVVDNQPILINYN